MIDVDGKYADFFTVIKRPGSGVCHCWRVTRLDGVQYLFTDHDEEVSVIEEVGSPTAATLTFTPINAFSVTATKKQQGMAVDNISIIGLVDEETPSVGITEEALIADLFADASIEVWLCSWDNPEAGLYPLKTGTFGTLTFRTTGFEAEMRGLAERLQRQVHRTFQIECSAVLGDSRCGVDLTGGSPDFKQSGTVTAVTDNRTFSVDIAQEEQWAQYGLCTFTGGNNSGLSREIINHTSSSGSPTTGGVLTLLIPMPFDVEVGDSVTVTAGCNKTFDHCKNKFDNVINYRGFHLMPIQEDAYEFPDAR